ncbi:MAG TPA: OmpH family outer membrane protein [Chitinophagaceae bacterium]|nr:OmpH family outer membrane protein [Chitinophagaceae bacterium]
MKNGLLLFNVVLLILVGILFYLYFAGKKNAVTTGYKSKATTADTCAPIRIAYFEMDSIENSFAMVKDVKNELGKKEDAVNNELAGLEKKYRNKVALYQSQGQTMTQVQSEMAQKDVMQMQQTMQNRKQALDQEYQDFYMRKMKDVKSRIEEFLKIYNAQKGFSYIFAYDPGLFYYRDTAFNITADVIKGLNDGYTKKK